MASLALVRLARFHDAPEISALAERNIAFNLKHYYAEEDGLGLIDERGKVKLGAIALAAMAIRECPNRSDKSHIESLLRNTVDALWQVNGEFRTFLRPANRNDCQNFYPGEAPLLWSQGYAESGDSQLLRRIERSFEYYQQWHQKNRNPAFVPWHTQAYWCLWRALVSDRHRLVDFSLTDRLREAIFEMNDWLIDIQQWEDAPSVDCRGRFYSPDQPFGPPHASSTAVYLEGLSDAYCMAKSVGDNGRAYSYKRSILRGIRSLAQLCFKTDTDMFYIKNAIESGVELPPRSTTTLFESTMFSMHSYAY